MRIAFLTSRFLPFSTGGGETHTYHLARSLISRGHSAEILLSSDDMSKVNETYEYQKVKVTMCPGDLSLTDAFKSPVSTSWLKKFLVSNPIDILHVMISGRCKGLISAAIEIGIPVVVTLLDFHDWCPSMLIQSDTTLCSGPKSIPDCHRCVLTPYRRLSPFRPAWVALPVNYRKYILKIGPKALAPLGSVWADLEDRKLFFDRCLVPNANFITPSKVMRRLVQGSGIPSDRILDMPYGVPKEFVGAGRPKVPSSLLRVGYFGRLVPEKGVHFLVSAVCQLPVEMKISLRIYGSNLNEAPEYVDRLRESARGDQRIQFCATVSQQDIPSVHRELDLVAIVSTWHENATIVLLESLAMGTPSLISNVEGMSQFIEEGKSGFKVAPGDVDGIRKRLLWCSENRDEVARMAFACRPVNTIEDQAKKIEATYARLILAQSAVPDRLASGGEMQ